MTMIILRVSVGSFWLRGPGIGHIFTSNLWPCALPDPHSSDVETLGRRSSQLPVILAVDEWNDLPPEHTHTHTLHMKINYHCYYLTGRLHKWLFSFTREIQNLWFGEWTEDPPSEPSNQAHDTTFWYLLIDQLAVKEKRFDLIAPAEKWQVR